ncbi:AIPR family protein [Austwickia chelonae]|uniref:AIPR family protein n=1 Tax=Austwickia chelonae TaxID=100225 RepID=UPI000E24F44B|nr:AIPR family protein [Austwickia chelonae]
MESNELNYEFLSKRIARVTERTGLGESASFLVWFLENVYRLEETDARDAVCDHSNDKGIDGIYVDHNNEEIHFLQAKIRQNDAGKIGDVGPKNLMGSVAQFDTDDKVKSILSGNADEELKRLIGRIQLADMVKSSYRLIGVYVTNESHNIDSQGYSEVTPNLSIFDREEIAARMVEVDMTEGKKGSFTFDTSYVDPLEMKVGANKDGPTMFVFPARALQLVHMDGIADGSLFRENVRYGLGNTSVNKAIRGALAKKADHATFILGHNGLIILCSSADSSKSGKLTIKDYSVVNGAQSLTSFYNDKSKLTDDLRVLVRVVEVQDEALARRITENSNNQNAIKPRDLRSNHTIQRRLQEEMNNTGGNYFFEIKRGEQAPDDATVITNDESGRALLAFDVQEPWSAHQIYKVFDEKYAEIFGRPEVTAQRVIFVHRLMGVVNKSLPKLKNRPMASYGLTRYFMLYLLSEILRGNDASRPYIAKPDSLTESQMAEFLSKCEEILKTVVVDLNVESKSVDFDYKTILKSPRQGGDLAQAILASYEKDVEREKAETFTGWTPN